jgi:hypothetical protein
MCCKKVSKKLFYINFFFSSCVIGTPESGITVRGRAVILKLNVSKSCDHKKSFLLGHRHMAIQAILLL